MLPCLALRVPLLVLALHLAGLLVLAGLRGRGVALVGDPVVGEQVLLVLDRKFPVGVVVGGLLDLVLAVGQVQVTPTLPPIRKP